MIVSGGQGIASIPHVRIEMETAANHKATLLPEALQKL